MVSDGLGRLVELANSWCIEQFLRVNIPVLERRREISVENMTSYRCAVEGRPFSFEVSIEDVDRARAGCSLVLAVLAT